MKNNKMQNDPSGDSTPPEQISGDEIYISMGLDPLDSIESNALLIPARGGGPCVPAYRIGIKFVDGHETIWKSLPLDDLIALIDSLIKVIEIDTLENTVRSIATLTADRRILLNRLKESTQNLTAIESYISKANLNGKDAAEYIDEKQEDDLLG